MITIPNEVFVKYIAYLTKTGVPLSSHAEYKKWLRYYLDFCDKYPVPKSKSERVRLFSAKLNEKKQSLALRQRAANAVLLYFQMKKLETREQKESSSSLYKEKTADYESVNLDLASVESPVEHPQTEEVRWMPAKSFLRCDAVCWMP